MFDGVEIYSKFELFVGFIQQGIVLLIDHTVTISTVSGKD